MMGARARCPVALVESGVGRIRAVHADGRAKVEIGFPSPACMHALHQSCDPKVSCDFLLSLIPRFRCGCCRILFNWGNCGNISAVSLRLLPVFCSQLLGKMWEYVRCGCCRTKSWMVTNKS